MNENCWKGYKKVGMKKKGNRIVPDCVAKSTQEGGCSFADYLQLLEADELSEKLDSRESSQTSL